MLGYKQPCSFITLRSLRPLFCSVHTYLYLSSDLPDHDNALCLRVVGEPLQAVDEVRAVERVAPDTYAGALTHA